jgi:hypothetical protein
MTKAEHVDEIAARLLGSARDGSEPSWARLITSQIRTVYRLFLLEARSAEHVARDARLPGLVERCRDAHLCELDFDESATVLEISWQEVLLRAGLRLEHERRAGAIRCARCGGRTYEVRYRDTGTRRPPGRHLRRGKGDFFIGRRCPDCGPLRL